MEQLSGLDNYMLYDEQGNQYNHVAALGIYDPSTAANGRTRFKDILHHFNSRIGDFPIFRRKLVEVPYAIDRPYWVETGEIDVEFHLRHIALPHPGDWRQLMIQTARLHSRPLDRSRPLWEIYVIEGLDKIPGMRPGCFALFLKVHRASVDGQHAAALLEAVHSIAAEDLQAAPRRYNLSNVGGPHALEWVVNAARNAVSRSIGLSNLYVSTLNKAGTLIWERLPKPFATAKTAPGPLPWSLAPPTRFNHPISANRVVDALHFPQNDIKAIRHGVPGCTIDDVFLSVCGGALRRYLDSKGELPDQSLCALVANRADEKIITRRKMPASNSIGGTPMALKTDIQDPLERLHAVRTENLNARLRAETLGLNLLPELIDNLPPAAGRSLMRRAIMPLINVTASNVRGPEIPLYVAGARLMHFYPVSIAHDYAGLNLSGFSYNAELWISLVACRNMLPDPGFFIECLRHSFQELLEAANRLSALRKAARDDSSNVYPITRPKTAKSATGKSSPGKSRASLRSGSKPAQPADPARHENNTTPSSQEVTS